MQSIVNKELLEISYSLRQSRRILSQIIRLPTLISLMGYEKRIEMANFIFTSMRELIFFEVITKL